MYDEPLYNDPLLKSVRRELRQKQTQYENVLWQHLRNKSLQELKFYRQYSVGSFTLDFYCPKLRLAIELDGAHHDSDPVQKRHDEQRDALIKSLNIRVLRFKNVTVRDQIEKVLRIICNSRPPLEARGGTEGGVRE